MYDTYWKFACARQNLFMSRAEGALPPWTTDPIISTHKFTNAYRASDRVSQYLIRNVIYTGAQNGEEVFFRILLFKVFNRIDTWELLTLHLGEAPSWRQFNLERYARVLDAAMNDRRRLYSAAYIMPSPPFGSPRKHRNHLKLIESMMRENAPRRVGAARSLQCVFDILRGFPSLGDFLAFQFTIDLNYSELIDFSEADFVVAGPGARDGIRKCFASTDGTSDAEIIAHMTKVADEEFARLALTFPKLGGTRPLQLIDCQNLFCETDKYARVAHPEFSGESGRTRIKQKFTANPTPIAHFYPPKWGLETRSTSSVKRQRSRDDAQSFMPAE